MSASDVAYTFDELSDKAKERVTNWLQDGYDWWHHTLSYWVQKLREEYGFYNVQIYFSLGYCQSDYVHIDGTIDLKHLLKMKPELFPVNMALQYLIERGNVSDVGVSESSTNGVHIAYLQHLVLDGVFEGADADEVSDLAVESAEELEHALQELVKTLSREIYNELRDEDEYQRSEENIREQCEANDYKFDEDGRII